MNVYDPIQELYDKEQLARTERSTKEALADRVSRERRKKARKNKKKRMVR